MSLQQRRLGYTETLLAAGTIATAGTAYSAAMTIKDPVGGLVLELDVTAAAAASGDTMDVTVQTLMDGTNWIDVCHFTQLLGNGGAKRYLAKISATEPQAMFEVATALTAGNVRHLIGDRWRVQTVLVDGGAHGQSFTLAVYATPI